MMKLFNFGKKKNSLDFVFVKQNALPKSFCNNVIEKFETDNRKYQGYTANGVDLSIKRSLDLNISNLEDWNSFDEVFFKSLQEGLSDYSDHFPEVMRDQLARILNWGEDTGYQVQKSQPGDFYIWHHDQATNRRLTFLWYLNDVYEDGYTEFLDGTRIQPETGKLILFPASWTHVHRGFPPKHETKYICTGWIYEGAPVRDAEEWNTAVDENTCGGHSTEHEHTHEHTHD